MKIVKSDFEQASVHTHVSPGESLKIIRELQGISQTMLALMVGIPQSNISAIENDVVHLGRERALAFAKALHVHPAVLLFPDFDIREVA